jgi:hypothetical protein
MGVALKNHFQSFVLFVFCPKAHGAIERAAGPSAIKQICGVKLLFKMDFFYSEE